MNFTKVAVPILLMIILISIFYIKNSNKEKNISLTSKITNDNSYSSNLIKEVSYTSKDVKGNEYIINAEIGEIDINNPDVIYLTNVKSIINLKNSEKINVKSDYGKYNTKNFDTIFSQNVIITYLENKITGEYLDFSLENNLMVISRNIIYTSLENILKADVLEMNIRTKDTKIFMYESNEKVNIESIN